MKTISVASNLASAVGSSITTGIIQLVTSSITARLLTHEQFGAYAIAQTIYTWLSLMAGSGLAWALVTKPTLTETESAQSVSTNAAIGLGAGLALAALSPVISHILSSDALTAPLLASSIGLVVCPSRNALRSLLQRSEKYRLIALVESLSFVAGGSLISITLAYFRLGALALSLGAVTTELCAMIAYTYILRTQLQRPCNFQRPMDLDRTGRPIATSQISVALSAYFDRLAAGRLLSLSQAGVYSRAGSLAQSACGILTPAIDKVILPSLARRQADVDSQHALIIQTFGVLTVLVSLPIMLGISLRDQVIDLALGQSWSACSTPFAVLLLAAYTRFYTKSLVALFLGTQQQKELTKVSRLNLLLTIGISCATAPFGLNALATGMLLVNLVMFAYLFRTAGIQSADFAAKLGAVIARFGVPTAATLASIGIIEALPIVPTKRAILQVTASIAYMLYWYQRRLAIRSLLGYEHCQQTADSGTRTS